MSLVLGAGIVVYALIAALVLTLCVGELLANRTADPLSLAGAALASAVWPATLVGILCAARFAKGEVRHRDEPAHRADEAFPRT